MNLQPVTLQGQHIRLEPMTMHHLDGLWRAGSDPELWSLTSSRIQSIADMREYMQAALDEQERGITLPFCTVERAAGEIVGSTRFGSISIQHKRVEIGWTFIAPSRQRTVVNTEAKYLMFRHAFEVWGCNRVELKTSALNMRSRNAMLRIGAREEGTLRRHMINPDGSVRDTVYFSVIAEEWAAVKAHIERLLRVSGSSEA